MAKELNLSEDDKLIFGDATSFLCRKVDEGVKKLEKEDVIEFINIINDTYRIDLAEEVKTNENIAFLFNDVFKNKIDEGIKALNMVLSLPVAGEEETKVSAAPKAVETDDFNKRIDDIPGIGEKTADKLREAGYHDIMALATAPVSFLIEECGLGDGTARKIIQEARSRLNMGFGTALDLMKKRENVGFISTSSKALNNLLGGKGVETQSITEAAASFGSGKTQLALQLAVNVQLPKDKGGLDGIAVYVDNENTFRPERIIQIANAIGVDPKKALENIKVARAYSSDHQILLAEKIPDLIEKEHLNVKLIVIDSLTGLFRAEFMGRGQLADRQQKLNRHLHTLQRLADRYNLAIFVTNQVMSRPDVFFGNPEAAIGGNIVAHASTFRMLFRKSRGDKRVAKLIDSPNLPEGEAVFRVCEEGIRDE